MYDIAVCPLSRRKGHVSILYYIYILYIPRAESIARQRLRPRQLVLPDVNSETPVAAALACDTSVAIYRY